MCRFPTEGGRSFIETTSSFKSLPTRIVERDENDVFGFDLCGDE